MSSEIAIKKIQVVKEILSLEDDKALKSIETFLRNIRVPKQSVQPMSIEEFEARIDQPEKDYENGNFTDAHSLKATNCTNIHEYN